MSDQASQLRGMIEAARGKTLGPASIMPESVPSGAVSFAPPPALRRTERVRVEQIPASRTVPAHPESQGVRAISQPSRIARAIAVSSGKGGVGKSNLAVNLAVVMSQRNMKVCLLDADLGLANADVLCNLQPRLTLEHVVAGKCRLAEAMLLAPGGFRLIPGASGVARLADLRTNQRVELLSQLSALDRVADVILIDCGAGIGSNVLGFAAAAHTVLVVTTPEPPAITDAYGMIKSLVLQAPDVVIRVVVNMAGSEHEATSVFNRINRVSQTFLRHPLQYGGMIPSDTAVSAAVRQRLPWTLLAPESAATAAVHRLVDRLCASGHEDAVAPVDGSDSMHAEIARPKGFFSRLMHWMGMTDQPDAD